MRTISKLLLSIFISTSMFAQIIDSTSSNLFPFDQYKLPETYYRKISINSLFSLTSRNFEQYSSNFIQFHSYSEKTLNYNFELTPSIKILDYSDDFIFKLNSTLSASYVSRTSDFNPGINGYADNKSEKSPAITFNNSLQNDFFLGQSEYFFSLSGALDFSFLESRNEMDYNNRFESSYRSGLSQRYLLKVGVGNGKLRDVTHIITALKFQNKLLMLGKSNEHFDNQTILNLAQSFSTLDHQNNFFDRPGKHFWQTINNTLLKENINLDYLNSYTSELLKETVIIPTFIRIEGFNYGINLGIEHFNYLNKSYGFIFSGIDRSEFTGALIELYSNYSKQINVNSQWGISLSINESVTISKNPSISQKYNINFNINYDYEISDRVITGISNTSLYQILNQDKQYKDFYNTTSLRLFYFLEDHISLNFSYDLNYNNFGRVTNFNFAPSGFTHNINFGCTYSLDKAFQF